MEEDNWLWHMYDTVKGSDWLGDQVIISSDNFLLESTAILCSCIAIYVVKCEVGQFSILKDSLSCCHPFLFLLLKMKKDSYIHLKAGGFIAKIIKQNLTSIWRTLLLFA